MISPAFQKILDETEKKYGKIFRPMARGKTQRVPTGVFSIDWCLGGGIPVNRICLIRGHKASFKTTLALKTMREYQARCGLCFSLKENCQCGSGRVRPSICVFIDVEHALEENYAADLGVVFDQETSWIFRPPHAEAACEYTEALAKVPEVGLIVLDSLADLMGKVEMESGYFDTYRQNIRASLIARMTRALIHHVDNPDLPRVVICLNHILPVRTGGEMSPGGEEQLYNSSTVIKLWPAKRHTYDAETGQEIQYGDNGKIPIKRSKKLVPKEEEGEPPLPVRRQEIGFLIEHSKVSPDHQSGEFMLILGNDPPYGFGDSVDLESVLMRAGRMGLISTDNGWGIGGEKWATQAKMKEAFANDRLKFEKLKAEIFVRAKT